MTPPALLEMGCPLASVAGPSFVSARFGARSCASSGIGAPGGRGCLMADTSSCSMSLWVGRFVREHMFLERT